MANNSNTTLKAQTYKLYIHNDGVSTASPESTDTAVSRIVVYANSVTPVTHNSKQFLLSLGGVNFVRKVYQPGHIEAEVQITLPTGANDNPTMADLQEMFVRKKVDLEIADADYDDDIKVATNYYIHEICPLFERDGTKTSVYVRLSIYSMDKLMTLNKFSQAYLGKKLGAEILTSMASSFPLKAYEPIATTTTDSKTDSNKDSKTDGDKDSKTDSKTDGANNTKKSRIYYIMPNVASLQHLAYTPSGASSPVEFLQPYLVQYNESFYDFLVRTANRCGEFLFFENGMLCLGLDAKKLSGEARKISNYSRLTYQQITDAPLTIDDYTRNSLADPFNPQKKESKDDSDDDKKKNAKGKQNVEEIEKTKGFPTEAFPTNVNFVNGYNAEVAHDEYYMLLFKDQFAEEDWYTCLGGAGTNVMDIISTVLNSTSLFEALSTLAVTYTKTLIQGALSVSDTNKKGNEIITKFGGEDATSAVPFFTTDQNTWLLLNYYSDIKKNEEAQQRKMVCADMGSTFVNVRMGDKITFPNDDQQYLVVQIELQSDQAWKGSYDIYQTAGEPVSNVRKQKIYAIPMADKKWYPPYSAVKPYREAAPQTAFVVENKDPKGQGRIRIRYPWQPNVGSEKDALTKKQEETKTALEKAKEELKKDSSNSEKTNAVKTLQANLVKINYELATVEAATPWIRMTTPMATTGGGMLFRPEVGDEVLVNYENGNIERPYVVGTLYSKNVVAPDGDRIIQSPNGHTIKIEDPTDFVKFLSGMLPGLKFLQSYKLWNSDWKIDGLHELLGGITMTDAYGLYKLKLSSHERKVQLSSPFGDVKIDAFTGITISAPNGNIKIKGKNIDIQASNNVKITSGLNVKPVNDNGRWWSAGLNSKIVGSTIGSTLVNETVGQLLDFSLLRSILEVFLRPIDGTMELKSYRYLKLQAGGGVAETDSGMYNKTGANLRRKSGVDGYAVLGNFIAMVNAKVDKYVADFVTAYNNFHTAWAALKRRGLYAENAALVSTPGSEDALLTEIFGKTEVKDECQINYVFEIDALLFDLDDAIKGETITATNAFVTLKKTAEGFNDIFKHKYNPVKKAIPAVDKFEQIYSEQGKAALDDVDCVLKKLANEVINGTARIKRMFNGPGTLTVERFTLATKKMKRAATAKILEESMGKRSVFWNFTLKKANDAPAVDAAIANSAEWIKYVNGLDIYVADSIGQNFVAGLVDGLTSAMSSSLSYERDVWQPGTKGEILMSNSSEKTLRFNGTTIVSDDNLYVDQADKKKVVARIRQLMLSFA